MPRRVAITGVSGFVGSAVAARLTAAGHEVIALTRTPVDGFEWRHYDLASACEPGLLSGVDSVLHCSYDLRLTRWADIEVVNVGGTRRLLDAADAGGVRCDLISSMSAYAGTTQLYGRAKLACEDETVARGGNAIRLGLVYGGDEGGMIGSLRRIAQLPVIPVFGARSHQFMVHIDDATVGLQRLLEAPAVTGQVAGLASPDGVRFGDLIKRLAEEGGRTARLIPIPWRPVYTAMRLAEAAGLTLPIRADSVLGLVRPAPAVLNVDLWGALGLVIRPSLAPELEAQR